MVNMRIAGLNLAFLVLVLLFVSEIAMASPSDALISYRSSDGNGTHFPKIRVWTSAGNGSWGPQIELPDSGSEITHALVRSSPYNAKLVLITIGNDDMLDAYVCTAYCSLPSSWTVTNDIGSVIDAVDTRRYDFEFESSTGDLVLVYAINSTNSSRDLAYQVLPAGSSNFSGLTENYIDDTIYSGDREYTWTRIDRNPMNTSEEMVLVAFDSLDPGGPALEPHINAWVWNGNTFGNQVVISDDVSSTSAGVSETGDAHQAKYAADGSLAMVVGANGSSGDVNYRTWNGSAWSGVSSFDISGFFGSGSGADLIWALLKADPATDDIQFIGVDSSADLGTAYWNGSTWSITRNIETAVNQAPARRPVDFAWNPSGSQGTLVWENDGGGTDLELMVCSPECDGSSSTVSTYAGNGRWITMVTNPTDNEIVNSLAVRLTQANDIGSFSWNGTNLSNYGDTVITDDTTMSNVELTFTLAFLIVEPPDITDPNVTLNSPANNSYLSTSSVTFNFTATDDNATTMNCSLYIDDVLNQTNSSVINGTATTFDVSGFADGTYNWSVACEDNSSNTGVSETWMFTINTVPNCIEIDTPGSYVQSNDYTGAPYPAQPVNDFACVVINSSDVVYDCAGYDITNNGTANATGIAILAQLSNITVKNCGNISQYRDGVYSYNSTDVNITNNTAYDNSYGIVALGLGNVNVTADSNTVAFNSMDGISFSGSGNAYSTGLMINNIAHNNGDSGLDGAPNDNIKYYYNTVYDNNGTGITNGGSSSNIEMVNNTVYGNNYGMWLAGDDSLIANNTIHDNTMNGIGADSAVNLQVLNNHVYDNGWAGIEIYNANNSQLINNTVSGHGTANPSNGIGVYASYNVLLQYNNVSDSNSSGIYAGGLTNISLYDNTVYESGAYGIIAQNGTAVNNHIYENDGVCLFFHGDYSTVINNSIHDCGSYNVELGGPADVINNTIHTSGAYLIYAKGNDTNIINNTAHGTATYGFYLDVTSGPNNVNVSNNTVYDTYNAIRTTDMTNSRITDNTVYDSGDSGIYATSSDNITVSGNTVYDSGAHGIYMPAGSNLSFILNTVYNSSGGRGIDAAGSSTVYALSNLIYDSSTYGLYLGGVTNATAVNNTVYNSGNMGMEIVGGDAYVENNTAYDNGLEGIEINSNNAVIKNNTLYRNWNGGLDVFGGSNVEIRDNVFYNNSVDFSISTSSGDYEMYNSIFLNPLGTYENFTNLSVNDTITGSYYINWTGNTTPLSGPVSGYNSFGEKWIEITNISPVSLESVVWHWTDAESSGYDESGFELWKEAWTDMNATLDTSANTLTVAPLDYFSIYGILQPQNCPVITSPGTYVQAADFQGAPNNVSNIESNHFACVVIAADDVIFDCNGYSITGDGTDAAASGWIGIVVNDSTYNATIRNCAEISNYTYSIFVQGANGTTIRNTSVSDSSSNAVYVRGSYDTNIVNNTFHDLSSFCAYYSYNSSTTAFLNNTVHDTGSCAFNLYLSPNNVVAGNAVYNAGLFTFVENSGNNTVANNSMSNISNDGFSFNSNSHDNNMVNNTLHNISGDGFYVQSSNNNNFVNNNVSEASHAFRLLNASDNTFTENLAYDTTSESFWLQDTWNNLFVNNTAHTSAADGFWVFTCQNTNFTDNTAYDVYDAGFDVFNCPGTRLVNNTAYEAEFGIFIHPGSDNSVLMGNTQYDSPNVGIFFAGVVNISITNNTAYSNDYGFYVANSSIEASGSRFFNNSIADYHQANNPAVTNAVSLSNMIFDNPDGLANPYQNFTNLSMNDTTPNGEGYAIAWTNRAPPPGFISFEGKWVEIRNNSAGVSIDSIVWHWTDAEAASYNEAALALWKYNGSWSAEILGPDTAANTLSTTNLNPASDYGIVVDSTAPNVSIQSPENITYSTTSIPLNYTAEDNGVIDSCWYVLDGGPATALSACTNLTSIPGLSEGFHNITVYANDTAGNSSSDTVYFTIILEEQDDDDKTQNWDVDFSSSCEGNVVTVTDDHDDPISGVYISISGDTSTSGNTDSNGEFSFSGCDMDVSIHAIAGEPYDPGSKTMGRSTISCSQCEEIPPEEPPEDGGAGGEGGSCVEDGDCVTGLVCLQNTCQQPPPEPQPEYECTSDADCDDAEYCDIPAGAAGGSCEPVAGQCGYPSNHQWTSYECGPEAGCPACPSGEVCEEHQCIGKSIECPEEGIVGSEQNCSATSGGEPCIRCEIMATLPDGSTERGRTDGNGSYMFTPDQEGEYNISLVSNGIVVASTVMASSVSHVSPDTGLPEVCLPLAFIALLLLLLLLWWRRKKKKPKKAAK